MQCIMEVYEAKESVMNLNWDELYTFLRSRVPRIIYALHFSFWRGQEEDIVEDVIQETMRRVLERVQMAWCGEAEPIRSLEHISVVIASNYCRDMMRKERRLVRRDSNEYTVENSKGGYADGLDIATEKVYQREVFALFAREISTFPQKQRLALLSDLANRMFFDEQPTPLQEAFLAVDIHLEDYKRPFLADSEERKRSAALLAHAYRRVATINRNLHLLEAS